MTPEEFTKEYLSNGTKMSTYHNAIRMLRDTGLETVLRRMGEPIDIALSHPALQSISAFESAERRGWYRALNFVFDFAAFAASVQEEEAKPPDFGAKERLLTLGYNDEDIKGAAE